MHVYICSRYEYCILPVCLYGGVCAACRIKLYSSSAEYGCSQFIDRKQVAWRSRLLDERMINSSTWPSYGRRTLISAQYHAHGKRNLPIGRLISGTHLPDGCTYVHGMYRTFMYGGLTVELIHVHVRSWKYNLTV